MYLQKLFFILSLLGIGNFLSAETFNASQSSFAILKQPIDARSAGMGRAYGAVAAGADALWWNPAGLGFGNTGGVSAGYQSFYDGISLQQFSLHSGAGRIGGYGLSVANVSAGSFESRGANGQLLNKDITPRIYALRLGMGKWLPFASISVGVELGYLSQYLGVVSDTAFESGLGVSWTSGPVRLSAGGRGLIDSGAPEELGTEWFAGAAWKIPIASKNILAAADVHIPSRGETSFNIGLEYLTPIGLGFRTGYGSHSDSAVLGSLSGFSLGMGIGYSYIQLDYGWTMNELLGAQHSLTLRYNFNLVGATPTLSTPPAEKLLENARALTSQKDIYKAVIAYIQYLNLNPHSALVWQELGTIYQNAGDAINADYCFEKAKEAKLLNVRNP